jgi:hypothetical protein
MSPAPVFPKNRGVPQMASRRRKLNRAITMMIKTKGKTMKTYTTTMKAAAVSFGAIKAVIEHYGLEGADGDYQFTAEMLAHAMAIDEMQGTTPTLFLGMAPKKAEDLEAAIKGRRQPNGTGWEEVKEEEIR